MYVNHKTKEAAWKPPAAWLEWELLKQPVEAVRHIVLPMLLLAYKDLFRVSGDKNAELYTGSSAMHTAQLDLLMVCCARAFYLAGCFVCGVVSYMPGAHVLRRACTQPRMCRQSVQLHLGIISQ